MNILYRSIVCLLLLLGTTMSINASHASGRCKNTFIARGGNLGWEGFAVDSQIVSRLKLISEENFRYADIAEKFETSFNFIEAGASVPPHSHDDTVFNLVLQGEFEVEISGESRLYTQGQWIFIPRGVTHSVKSHSKVTLLELWEK